MGVARSDVEVYDAGKEQLRVELFGGGDVLTMEAPEGGHRAERVRLKDMTFTRR
jgi:hypothetical protein